MTRRIALGTCIALSLYAGDVMAFNQTMTCDVGGGFFACKPDETPIGVSWPERSVEYLVHEEGSKDHPSMGAQISTELLTTVEQSFTAWSTLDCAEFEFVYAGPTSVRDVGYSEALGENNINIVMWTNPWPNVYSPSAYALTSVTYDPSTGRIADADIEVNDEFWDYSIGPSNPETVDVQNMMTHEVGHFIGLDHTFDATTTMFGRADLGEISKRDLAQDDIDGMCAIYPAGDVPEPVDKGCCAHTPRPAIPRHGALALGLLALLAMRRSRERSA